ncbi:ABC transporter permease [Fastidiosipila sanguinis]|uniref:Protein lplB n=1 Tax=Fastidiosipila sanguinis TaxID=236753 RepID=A0A2S0KMA3_9FIRM|nr:ABC transporter permease subunit [Fastidiosipila sanguinis]AVM42138.1 protein lplB [Fastidiosipila sanguinis]
MKSKLKLFKKQIALQSMVVPGIIFLLIFSYIPIAGLVIAFMDYGVLDTIKTADWAGLDNFKNAFSDRYFWQAVRNTLGISFLKLLIGFPFPIILAIMMQLMGENRFKRSVQTITYLPHFLSWIVLGGMVISWFSVSGIFNQLLARLNLLDEPKNYLLDKDNYWMIAVMSDVWKEAGWNTVLYIAAMTGIDPTFYEAAKIDGASILQQIRYITIPSIKYIISLNLIMTISGLLGSNLDQTLVLMNTQNRKTAEVINSYVYRIGIAEGNFSYSTAVGLAVSIVSLILLVTANFLTKRLNDGKSVF